MLKKPTSRGLLLALVLPFACATAHAATVYKIDIEKSFIKASANGNVVELKLAGESLVVSNVPAGGFYGLQVGDRITKVNGTEIHSTDAFIDALNETQKDVADFQVVRAGQTLALPIPKKGYSWFF